MSENGVSMAMVVVQAQNGTSVKKQDVKKQAVKSCKKNKYKKEPTVHHSGNKTAVDKVDKEEDFGGNFFKDFYYSQGDYSTSKKEEQREDCKKKK
jgi:hypothetical protein